MTMVISDAEFSTACYTVVVRSTIGLLGDSYASLARDSISTLYAIARPSVCPSVCHTGGSVKNA